MHFNIEMYVVLHVDRNNPPHKQMIENDKQKIIFEVLHITNMKSLCKKSKPHPGCIFHQDPFQRYFLWLLELPQVLSEMSGWVENLLKIVT